MSHIEHIFNTLKKQPRNLPNELRVTFLLVILNSCSISIHQNLAGNMTACFTPTNQISKFVRGPDINAQLTKVLSEMQTYFRALSGWKKHFSCQWLIKPPMAIMAWDIHQLYLPETRWLRLTPFSPPCGQPSALMVAKEDLNTCRNSIRVAGKCNLAGTVNYATYGIVMKECFDFYTHHIILFDNILFFTERGMKTYIFAYKILDSDDPVPPTEFAVATYNRGPTGWPTTENRKHCLTACGAPATAPTFTFVWEPFKKR